MITTPPLSTDIVPRAVSDDLLFKNRREEMLAKSFELYKALLALKKASREYSVILTDMSYKDSLTAFGLTLQVSKWLHFKVTH